MKQILTGSFFLILGVSILIYSIRAKEDHLNNKMRGIFTGIIVIILSICILTGRIIA